MSSSDSNPQDQLKTLISSSVDLSNAATPDKTIKAILDSVDGQSLPNLVSFFERHCAGARVSSRTWPRGNPFPRSGCTGKQTPSRPLPEEEREVCLVWPHKGQYHARTAAGDAFIHPDPVAALREELDRFLKDKLLSQDAPLKAAAERIIDLIARAQTLKKHLWLKPKFVLETHYCITLDRLPDALFAEVAANDAQRVEWVRLCRIDRIQPGLMEPGYSEPLTVEFLKHNPYLMLETQFFDSAFTERLLASLDDIDATLDGLLIRGDNFHALTLLEPRYREGIDCIYIDPPYNTGGADLPYHDRYDRSSWLTMMDNRLRLAYSLLKPGGPCFISIDENEQARLELLLAEIFAPEDFVATFVWEAGRKNDSKLVSISHEYMLCYMKDLADPARKRLTWRVRKEGIDEIYFKARSLIRRYGGDFKQASAHLRRWLNGLPDNHPARRHRHYSCVDARGVYHPGNISWPGGGGPKYEVLHPVTGRPCKVPSRGWMYPTPERMAEAIRDGLVHFGEDEKRVPCAKVYLKNNEDQAPNSVFYQDGDGSDDSANQELAAAAEQAAGNSEGAAICHGSLRLTEAVAGVERSLIDAALRRAAGNQAKAAHYLGIPRTTLRDKMTKYGLATDPAHPQAR